MALLKLRSIKHSDHGHCHGNESAGCDQVGEHKTTKKRKTKDRRPKMKYVTIPLSRVISRRTYTLTFFKSKND